MLIPLDASFINLFLEFYRCNKQAKTLVGLKVLVK